MHQALCIYLQGQGNCFQRIDGGRILFPFQFPDIVAVQARKVGQLFLRQPSGPS
jgi:hypothetical protein